MGQSTQLRQGQSMLVDAEEHSKYTSDFGARSMLFHFEQLERPVYIMVGLANGLPPFECLEWTASCQGHKVRCFASLYCLAYIHVR
jgi:hypothetical protein